MGQLKQGWTFSKHIARTREESRREAHRERVLGPPPLLPLSLTLSCPSTGQTGAARYYAPSTVLESVTLTTWMTRPDSTCRFALRRLALHCSALPCLALPRIALIRPLSPGSPSHRVRHVPTPQGLARQGHRRGAGTSESRQRTSRRR